VGRGVGVGGGVRMIGAIEGAPQVICAGRRGGCGARAVTAFGHGWRSAPLTLAALPNRQGPCS